MSDRRTARQWVVLTVRRIADLDRKHLLKRSRKPQTALLLTKLPLEIRQFIYDLVFTEELRVTFTVARRKEVEEVPRMQIQCFNPWHSDTLDPSRAINGCARTAVLALPSTCRQLYIETIDHRYSRNTWLLNRPADLLFLKNNIPAQRFATMTSLMLWLEYWRLHEPDDLSTLQQPLFKTGQWNDLWRAIAAMPRLQRLRVSIIKGRRRNDELWVAGQTLLNPLWAVTQPGEFVVWLSWPQEDTEKFAGAPFRLEAPNINS